MDAVFRAVTDRHDARTRSPLDPELGAAEDRVVAFWDGGFAECVLPAHGEIVIGRGKNAGVCIDHPTVSREHARIVVDGGVFVVDLGSHNGTRLAGQRLAAGKPVPLAPGDMVELGSAVVALQAPRTRGLAEPEDDSLDALVRRVAESELSVILLGETGVGKDVTAERIHQLSARASGPLVRLNCAALPEALLESELFGHERGAFTGAQTAKIGLLEAAHRGTVFFDEVAELPPATQAKLLRAIETREIMRVGSVTPRPIDVRFVAATNQPLEELVANGQFRRDLYFRLAGITISIPPLRARAAEIPVLARKFLEEARQRAGRPELRFSNAAMARLRAHEWPGNIRELKNVIERAVVLCPSQVIERDHLLLSTIEPSGARAEDPERQRIIDALEEAGGNQTRAARLLGISRRTLVNKLDRFQLPRPRKPS